MFTTYRRVCLIFITFFLLLHRLFFWKNLSWGSFQFWPFSCFQTTLYSVNLKTELLIEAKLRAFHKYWKILSPNKESNRTPYIILRSNTLPPSHRENKQQNLNYLAQGLLTIFQVYSPNNYTKELIRIYNTAANVKANCRRLFSF